jgi:microcystin-dependent protein
MKYKLNTRLSAVVLLSGLGMAAFSPATYACTSEPVIASMCVMAISPTRFPSFNNTYTLAMGQTMAISQNAALFSLLGTTYGGNGQTTFMLPDLRGKVIVGYNPNSPGWTPGATGGSATIRLTVAQLPPHNMQITAVPVTLSGVTAVTTLAGLTATANLSGVTVSGPATGLTIKASSSSNGANTPSGNYLGKSNGAAGNIYTNTTTPDVTLNTGSIGGNISLTVGDGVTAPVSISGNASTVVTGSGQANGVTSTVGSGADVPVMPPYLVMPYYIATNGIYPSSD